VTTTLWRIETCYWLYQVSSPALSIIWRQGEESYSVFPATGTLKGLILAHYSNLTDSDPHKYYEPATPAGIWIDRLQECPEELTGATPEQVNAILLHLRQGHPNGV
jgi:hypothetical protein